MAILSCSCGSRTGTDRAGVRQDTTFDILCCEAVSVVHQLETLVQRPPGRMILVSPTVYCFKLNFSCSYVFILQLYHAARERVSHVKGSSCALDMFSVCTVGCRRTTFSNHLLVPMSRSFRRDGLGAVAATFFSFIFPPLLHLLSLLQCSFRHVHQISPCQTCAMIPAPARKHDCSQSRRPVSNALINMPSQCLLFWWTGLWMPSLYLESSVPD